MFAVVYSFKTKENKEPEFIEAWKDMTKLIYKFEGSLGSRLHKENKNHYIAYAKWPNREIWKQSGNKLPSIANEIRIKMRSSCESIETIYELELIEDLIEENPHRSHL